MKSLIYSEGGEAGKRERSVPSPHLCHLVTLKENFFYKRKVTNIFALAYVVISMYLKNLVTP